MDIFKKKMLQVITYDYNYVVQTNVSTRLKEEILRKQNIIS